MLLRVRYNTTSRIFRVLDWTPGARLLECNAIPVTERNQVDGSVTTMESHLDSLTTESGHSRFVVYPIMLPNSAQDFQKAWAFRCEHSNQHRRVIGIYRKGNAKLEFFGKKVREVDLVYQGVSRVPLEWDFGRWQIDGSPRRYDSVLFALMAAMGQ